jgi:hypothetical protein
MKKGSRPLSTSEKGSRPLFDFSSKITNALIIDPVTPSTLYAATGNAVYKSTNGGASWSRTSLIGSVQTVTLDPTAPSTLYAGRIGSSDHANAFVAKMS